MLLSKTSWSTCLSAYFVINVFNFVSSWLFSRKSITAYEFHPSPISVSMKNWFDCVVSMQLLWVIPLWQLQWTFLFVGMTLSVSVLVFTLWPSVRNDQKLVSTVQFSQYFYCSSYCLLLFLLFVSVHFLCTVKLFIFAAS